MNLYEKYVLPKLVHCACNTSSVMSQRSKVVSFAYGKVLEVGLGSGLNLPYYDANKVSKVLGLDPSTALLAMAQERADSVNFEVEFICSTAEELSLESGSIDTILVTYSLCTIADVGRALEQMARVLKPGGQLIFCEHGVAPDVSVGRLQNFINPLWKRIGGGCHLNRDIPKLVEQGGFALREVSQGYIPGWRPASFNYWGRAMLP